MSGERIDRPPAADSFVLPEGSRVDSPSKHTASAADLKLYDRQSTVTTEGDPTLRVQRLLGWGALVAVLFVPVVTLFDIGIARWFDSDPFPSDLDRTIQLSEAYSHGVGVLFIVIAIWNLAPECRWSLPRLATMALGASALATVVKMFILRPRPSNLNLDLAGADAAWLWRFDWQLQQLAAFDAGTRAFPSGGTATAVALTVGLSLLFPRGRNLFITFSVLTMLQRMQSTSHFFSDAIGGLACGLLWCYVCLHPKLLGALFEHLEPVPRDAKVRPESEPQQAAA